MVERIDADDEPTGTVRGRSTVSERTAELARIAICRDTTLKINLEPFQLGIEHKVDDASDRVRTVSGRRAAGDDVDAADEPLWDDVDVDRPENVGRRQTLAIEQNQRSRGSEPAQVEEVLPDIAVCGRRLRV